MKTVLINHTHLNPVTKFCYLGSIMSSAASLDMEVESRIRIASFSFGQLKDCVWSQNIRLVTKCKVYRAVVISALLYGCETWCPYQRHLHQIDQLQQHHQCFLMKITWQEKVPNIKVLSWTWMPAFSTMVMSDQLCWAGHIAIMPDRRLPKDIMYGQLSSGTPNKGDSDCDTRILYTGASRNPALPLQHGRTWPKTTYIGGTPSGKV